MPGVISRYGMLKRRTTWWWGERDMAPIPTPAGCDSELAEQRLPYAE